MRIAVIEHAGSGDYAEYIFSLIDGKAKQNDYQIKTWSNSVPVSQQRIADDAVVYIYIESTSTLLLNWLYKVKIPSILKKIRAGVVVDLNGITSDKIKIPQFVAAAPFLFNKNLKKLDGIEKFAFKNLEHSLQSAESVLLYSEKRQNDLSHAAMKKLHAIPFTAPAVFKTFEWHEKIMIKAQHADNKEYFVSVIDDTDVDSFILLLQAFSKFKKWQQSSMQLLVLPKFESLDAAIKARHKTYKYREDVRLTEGIEEKQVADIIASAYAFIHITTANAHLLILSVAMQCSLPVISFEDDDVKEYVANAGLYCKEKDAGSLGNILIQLYKDENLHAQLKEAAKMQSANLSRAACENKLWQLLESADNT
ncbi:MAG TPA: glycosyltransferase [Parafilimonas sp.]|nr:glycosyltransferase [Parafilimonas sp.]